MSVAGVPRRVSIAGEPRLISALPMDPLQLIDEETHDPPQTESQQAEEENKNWDVFGLSSDEWKDTYRTDTYTMLMKLLKIVVYLITFCIMLGCAVSSKASLLLMTSAIGNRSSRYPLCSNYSRNMEDSVIIVKNRIEWIWCLLFALFVPEILTFMYCVRICIFKKVYIPRLSTFLTVLFAESLHVFGIVFMLFVMFPRLHVLKALIFTNAVCIVPSFFNVLSSWNTDCQGESVKRNFFGLVPLFLQLTVVVSLPFDEHRENNIVDILGVVSCLLVSCAWWENFCSDQSRMSLRFKDVKDNLEECRPFLYLFISLWKVGLILASYLACVYFFNTEYTSFKAFTDEFFHVTFKNVSVSIVPPEFYQLDKTLDKSAWEIITPYDHGINRFLPVIVACIHIMSSNLCYMCGKFVCKICIQGFSYALPIVLTVPTAMCLLYFACEMRVTGDCRDSPRLRGALPYFIWNCPEVSLQDFFITRERGILWIFWIVSQCWLTHYIWSSKKKRMASTSELFVTPMYCTALIDQSMALNTRRDAEDNDLGEIEMDASEMNMQKPVPRILACATMWHETPDEMEQLLKSIMRMDEDQCLKRAVRNQLKGAAVNDYYEMEAHIFFDDAFVINNEDDTRMVINNFVKDLITSVDTAAKKIYPYITQLDPPIKVPTPFGGRLIWTLPGDNTLVAHLKNKDLIRHKKRWSQVMYMYYLLGFRLMDPNTPNIVREELAKNTFILALDGDIDFKPDAVQLLVDLMKRNQNLGAACGRIHPVGSGMMVYYQKFEYAIGHWLQKATEHMIGCVLCSPGCFSLFRAEALMQDNVIRRYACQSREAIEYVQFDQGEDRWLCTLLLQSGSRVEYSAASDAYTHCPESFAEFYTQRRRWAPSTMANIMDLIINYKKTVENNDNISLPYIGYQMMLMVGTVLGPGTIFLMLLGAMVAAFNIWNWQSLLGNFIPVAFFIVICFVAKNDTQILVAQILSAAYALLMMAVIVGISLQIVLDGMTSPTAIFLIAMAASFVIAAILHPREFSCVIHGMIYFLSVPSMYMLLTLYSIINLHVVSWGTREVATKKTRKQIEMEKMEAAKNQKKYAIFDWFGFLSDKRTDDGEEEGSISFGLANLFRCMCCTYPKQDPTKLHLVKIGEQLESIKSNITSLQRQVDSSSNRLSGFRRRSSIHGLPRENLLAVPEDDDQEENEQEEIEGETDEHPYNQIKQIPFSHVKDEEYWLTDPILAKSRTCRLFLNEETFWNELIEKYLKPIDDNPQEKAKAAAQLIDLRNKVVFGMLMLNSLFILIVYLLQMQKDTLYIEWPFNGKVINIAFINNNEVAVDLEFLQLEPINLILVFFFSVIVVIQFVAMLFHRFQTISHILASTELTLYNDETKPEVIMSKLEDLLQRLNLQPDDTVDGDPTTRRRSTVCRLEQKRQERPRQVKSLSVSYEQTLIDLLQDESQTVSRAKRISRNPSLIPAIRRLSVSRSGNSSPMTSSARNSMMLRDIQRLDNAFGTPRSSRMFAYTNKGFDGSLEGSSSVRSSASMNQHVIPSIFIQQPSRTRASTPMGSMVSLRSIEEKDES